MLAALVSGTMTVCAISPGSTYCAPQATFSGKASTKDCGMHSFVKEDGTVVRVTIACARG